MIFPPPQRPTSRHDRGAKRSCHRKACVAVALKLGVIMHAMWSDGTFYVGDPAAGEGDAARRAHR